MTGSAARAGGAGTLRARDGAVRGFEAVVFDVVFRVAGFFAVEVRRVVRERDVPPVESL
ncbi:MAG: hypothetical protein M5U18_16075 [Dehalococcoidia bacterium]|nr:hypothetical protein [Dehalococcoidia bacterium]